MAIRNDFTIDWDSSPRVITVAAPSTECSMQDLLDTLRHLESLPSAMDNAVIVDASGKEVLDATTKVGITVTLQNAVIGFEARTGPDWIVCSLVGGNTVAVDLNGGVTEFINPTAFVTIKSQSSSSATLQEQDALQYASFDGGVSVDLSLTEDCTGTIFPVGTVEHPVNNWVDAKAIAEGRGFDKFWLFGNAFITGSDDVSYFTVQNRSDNPTQSIVAIDASANTEGTLIKRCTVSGTLDNGVILEECLTGALLNVNGFFRGCVFGAYEIVLGGDVGFHATRCESGVPNPLRTEPSINIGSGQACILSAFDGEITFYNKTGVDVCQVFGTGIVRVDETCVAGEIELYGDIFVVQHPLSTTTVINRTSSTKEENAQAVWEYII